MLLEPLKTSAAAKIVSEKLTILEEAIIQNVNMKKKAKTVRKHNL